jgi:hypothetical protein
LTQLTFIDLFSLPADNPIFFRDHPPFPENTSDGMVRSASVLMGLDAAAPIQKGLPVASLVSEGPGLLNTLCKGENTGSPTTPWD